ncbi:DUF1493 family protein [uncultured Acetobacteroides sp.]|uniref:DUF1493 family protein n=1 Tax=uncultured Acetobacteroides sp. TaxID=1760811 RepID=UPI0029F57776|nr:DUF1493 family protein [uncultured Acetobacteroides sp.]
MIKTDNNYPVNKESFDTLVKFFEDLLGIKINAETILFKDLSLVGHDASEFMIRFSERFEVDLTDFKFNDYFVEESNIPFLYWIYFFFRKEKLKRKEISVPHLLEIIKEKRWIEV